MLIRIAIERTAPLSGTVAAGDEAPVPFGGWLEMLRVIAELVNASGQSAGPASPLAGLDGGERRPVEGGDRT